MTQPQKPTQAEIRAAAGQTVPDVIGPGLRVLFCGINPGLYSGATGHHFARPGNRFWPVLHAAGFTPRLLAPHEEQELLAAGCGVTNLVARATATAAELARAELVAGRQRLEATVSPYRPRFVAVLGISAYRAAFKRPKAVLGPQPETLAGAGLWLLPNPSGLNAHYQLQELAGLFRELREAAFG
jgi:TDG/mug DNA glycosylase family protein